MGRVIRRKKPDYHVYTFRWPSLPWSDYTEFYIRPGFNAACKFAEEEVERTRLHAYVVNPVTDGIEAEYHPPPVQIAPKAPTLPTATPGGSVPTSLDTPGVEENDNNMMVKIKKKAGPKQEAAKVESLPGVFTAKDLRMGPQISEEENYTYYEVFAAGVDSAVYHVGQDDKGWFLYDPEGETGWERAPGFPVARDRAVLLDRLARLLSEGAPMPKVASIPDPRMEGFVLVKAKAAPTIHPAFPPLDDPRDDDYYRLDPQEGRVAAVVSVDAEGVHLAWDRCGGCSSAFQGCSCKAVSKPRSIVWCLERSASGWDTPTSYKSYIPTTGSNEWVSPRTTVGKPATTAPKAAPVRSSGIKVKEVTGDAMVQAMDASGDLDMSALGAVAEEQAKSSTRKVLRRKK